MQKVMILDTETAGFKKPLIPVEVAYLSVVGDNPLLALNDGEFHQLYQLPVEREMEWGAVATHHILPGDLTDCPVWDSAVFRKGHGMGALSTANDYDFLVGHNVDFDWEVIGCPDVRRIDTLAMSRFFYPDLDAHKLSAMMYFAYGLNSETRDRLRAAHSAVADATHCLWILQWLAEHFGLRTWNDCYAISEQGRIPLRMTFGKYGPKDGIKGMLISDMIKDKSYVSWLLNKADNVDDYLRKAIKNPRKAYGTSQAE